MIFVIEIAPTYWPMYMHSVPFLQLSHQILGRVLKSKPTEAAEYRG